MTPDFFISCTIAPEIPFETLFKKILYKYFMQDGTMGKKKKSGGFDYAVFERL